MSAGDVEREARDGLAAGIERVADRIVAKTKDNLPEGDPADDPDPEYALADHIVTYPDGDGLIIEVRGAYAAKQHEQLNLKHPRGGGAKFLERALVEVVASEATEIVASEVRARLAAGL